MINNDEVITSKQGIFLVSIFTVGTSIILSGITLAKQDIWISFILAFIASIPLIFIYSKILSFFPGKSIYEIMDLTFGKILGRVFAFLFILYFLYLSALCLRNITEFIQVVSLRLSPQYFSGLWIILVSAYMVKSGLGVFGRWSNFTFVFIMLLVIVLFGASIPQIDFDNILPVLYNGWGPVLKNSISIFSFPFGEVVVFLAFFNNLSENKKTFKIFLLSFIISGSVLLLSTIRSIFILGFPLVDNTYFPAYYTNTLVRLDSIIENVAIFSTIILLLAGLAKFTTCLFSICIGLKYIFNSNKYSTFSLPVGTLSLIISQLIFTSTMEMMESVMVYHYYALPFQVLLPLIILIFSWRKTRKLGNKN